jgi:uncharacterized protein (DUF58 family)
MVSKEALKKMKQIELATRRFLRGSRGGDQQSAVKGVGFEFDQLREYQIGDDVRAIDWKSSARMDQVLVKQYIQDRNRVVILAVDISASTAFGSEESLKSSIMAEIASVLALVANHSKDAVSLLLFSDEVELFIPLGHGLTHVRTIMEKIFTHQPQRKRTSIEAACNRLLSFNNTDGIVLIISDFIDESILNSKKLLLVAKKFDTIAVRCLGKNEHALPSVGFLSVVDAETETHSVVDMRSSMTSGVAFFLGNRFNAQKKLLQKSGIDLLEIAVEKPFVDELVRFFQKRMNC